MEKRYPYRWLQISNLHVCDCTETNMMEQAFKQIRNKYEPKFLVVSGGFRDIDPDHGTFDLARDYLDMVVSALDLHKNDVFLAPGDWDANDLPFRDECICTIIEKFNSDKNRELNSDAYLDYTGKKNRILYDAFEEYEAFVRDFYGNDLDETDERISNASKVMCKLWDDKINVIILNTALLLSKKNTQDQIADINALSKIQISKSHPSIVLAHHSFHNMVPSHKRLFTTIAANLNVRAYLCGAPRDIPYSTFNHPTESNATIPIFACDYSAPQKAMRCEPCAIMYTCDENGMAEAKWLYFKESKSGGKRFIGDDDTINFKMF